MTIVFYKVNNVCEYSRSSFNGDTPDVIRKKLSELPEDQVRFYDLDHYGYGSVPAPNLADFQEDYNDEEFDGGWWCIVLNDNDVKKKEFNVAGFLSIQASLVRRDNLQIKDFLEFVEKWKKNGLFKEINTESYHDFIKLLETRHDKAMHMALMRTNLIETIMCESISSNELRIDIQHEFGQFDCAQFCENCGKVMWKGYSWDGNTYCSLPCVVKGEDIDETTANVFLEDAEEPDSVYYYTEWN